MTVVTSCPKYKCFSDGTYLVRGKRVSCSGFGKPFCKYYVEGKYSGASGVVAESVVDGLQGSSESLQSLLGIPESFDIERVLADGAFSCELFFHPDIKTYYSKGSLLKVQDFMMGLWSEIYLRSSMVMRSVYLFGASSLVDFRAFAWVVSVQAFKKGMSVLPALHLSDLSALRALQSGRFSKTPSSLEDVEHIKQYSLQAAQGATLFLQRGHDYADYLSASFVFLFDDYSVTPEDINVLQGFISQRASRGLPTYVLSSVDPSRRSDSRAYLFGMELSAPTSTFVSSAPGFSSMGGRLDTLMPLFLERRQSVKKADVPGDAFTADGDAV